MAQIDARELLPTERPSTSGPDPAIRLNVSPNAFGGAVAKGTEEFGADAFRAGDHWGAIAADDMANQYNDAANKILHGDPNKTVTNPDGSTTPDPGYIGLKGRAALDARQGTEKQLNDLYNQTVGKLATLDQRRLFDDLTRRQKAINSARMGEHADREGNTYAVGVNTAALKVGAENIGNNPNDEEDFKHQTADMILAANRLAQAKGAQPGDAMWNDLENGARAAAAQTRILAVGATDPTRAMQMAEQYKGDLGSHYHTVVDHFRPRVEQNYGRQVADSLATGAPPPNGGNSAAVLRHFEGFKDKAYWDVNHFRAGYGSDTYTTADGKVHEVTADTVVTKEDAERDLERRTAESEDQGKKAAGAAWDKYSPQTRASVASVIYNYGAVPGSLLGPLASGDQEKVADAIRGLARDNGGVNGGRRASEANNISPYKGGNAETRPQGDMVQEVLNMHLAPQAEAAALARISHIYAADRSARTASKTAFNQRLSDSVEEARQTGVSSRPLAETDFTRQFGQEEGSAKYADYTSDLTLASEGKAIQGMSTVDMQKFLAARMPAPGQAGYAHAIKRYNELQKYGQALEKERRDDPAGAVSRDPAVQAAFSSYDQSNPQSFGRVAAARLAAQENLGIEPEYRSPITKGEALELTAPLDRALPGSESKVLGDTAVKFRQMFGDQAPQALAFALRARKVHAEVAQQAAAVFGKLTRGEPLTREEAHDFDNARESAAARAAVEARGAPGAGTRDGAFSDHRPMSGQDVLRRLGAPENESHGTEPSTISEKPAPTPGAIEYLLRNPQSGPDFDKKYGTGLAKEIRQRYPVAPGLP